MVRQGGKMAVHVGVAQKHGDGSRQRTQPADAEVRGDCGVRARRGKVQSTGTAQAGQTANQRTTCGGCVSQSRQDDCTGVRGVSGQCVVLRHGGAEQTGASKRKAGGAAAVSGTDVHGRGRRGARQHDGERIDVRCGGIGRETVYRDREGRAVL